MPTNPFMPKQIFPVYVVGTYARYRTWCRENGINPHEKFERFKAYHVNSIEKAHGIRLKSERQIINIDGEGGERLVEELRSRVMP